MLLGVPGRFALLSFDCWATFADSGLLFWATWLGIRWLPRLLLAEASAAAVDSKPCLLATTAIGRLWQRKIFHAQLSVANSTNSAKPCI